MVSATLAFCMDTILFLSDNGLGKATSCYPRDYSGLSVHDIWGVNQQIAGQSLCNSQNKSMFQENYFKRQGTKWKTPTFLLLVHSIKAHKSQGWARPKSGSQSHTSLNLPLFLISSGKNRPNVAVRQGCNRNFNYFKKLYRCALCF